MRFLMRGGMSPLEELTINDIIVGDRFGGNSGNLLYLYGVFRTLYTKANEIHVDHYKTELSGYSEEEMDYINSEYDAYILPLADAFRWDFKEKLQRYINFFHKLRIPLIIIGVGLRAPYEPKLSEGFPFDEEVKKFIATALEHTACIGVRGNITGEYLKTLGFHEKDYCPIGCPSMYTYGNELSAHPLDIRNKEMKISVNFGPITNDLSIKFLLSILEHYPNSSYIGQEIGELRTYYLGHPYNINVHKELWPSNLKSPIVKNGQFKVFANVNDWFDFMKSQGLSIGGRLHGNIAAVLSGCPAVFLPADTRMRELVEFHHFPQVPAHKISENENLVSILNRVELDSHLSIHNANFLNYLEFLDNNGLSHIYKNHEKCDAAPIEIRGFKDALKGIIDCSQEETIKRQVLYYSKLLDEHRRNAEIDKRILTNELLNARMQEKKYKDKVENRNKEITKLKSEKQELKNENKNLKKKNTILQEKLNSKLVRLALKIRKILGKIRKRLFIQNTKKEGGNTNG